MKHFAHLTAAPIAAAILLAAAPLQAGSGEGDVAQAAASSALCGKRTDIVRTLGDQFQETQQAVGVVDRSAILEIFVSTAGTWTIIATGADGNSCLVASGEGWDSTQMVAGLGA